MDPPTLFVLVIDGMPDSLVLVNTEAEVKRLADKVLGVYTGIEVVAASKADWEGWYAYLALVGNGQAIKPPMISIRAAKAALLRRGW